MTPPSIVQDETIATYEGPCEPEHGVINFSAHGQLVHNTIRGCDPQPGASASLNGSTLKLFGSSYLPGGGVKDVPGTVLSVTDQGVDVSVIGGRITLQRVQQLGSKKVSASEVLSVGDILQ